MRSAVRAQLLPEREPQAKAEIIYDDALNPSDRSNPIDEPRLRA